MSRHLVFLGLLIVQGVAFAKDPPEPCRTRSRQMTLVKNCYTGDMIKPTEGGAQFFSSTELESKGANYCYNSLVSVEHKAGQVRIHVLKDSKDGKFHAYEYAVSPDELKKMKKDTPLLVLKGLKGSCFTKNGNFEACQGGILKAIGWKETDAPMVVAMGKGSGGRYTISHLAAVDPENVQAKELEGVVLSDHGKVTDQLLQEVRKKIVNSARAKMSSVHHGNTSPRKLASASEQFRYCSLAFEGFLKFNKLNDPFTAEEKMTLATLTNYMNDAAKEESGRAPASTPRE